MSTSVVIEDDRRSTVSVRINEDVIFTADAYDYGESGLIDIVMLVKELCDNFGIPCRDEVDMQDIHDHISGFMPD